MAQNYPLLTLKGKLELEPLFFHEFWEGPLEPSGESSLFNSSNPKDYMGVAQSLFLKT